MTSWWVQRYIESIAGGQMVVLLQKVGTLFIEYRPADTMSAISDDEGIVDENACNLFILKTKFFPGYVPLLPIYSLDARCYSQLRIKCYSIFDALDFISHLDLQEFEFKFVPSKLYDPVNAGIEFDIKEVALEGAPMEYWSMQIGVSQQDNYLFVTNRESSSSHKKDLKQVYVKRELRL
jgi:hypothetical protein